MTNTDETEPAAKPHDRNKWGHDGVLHAEFTYLWRPVLPKQLQRIKSENILADFETNITLLPQTDKNTRKKKR